MFLVCFLGQILHWTLDLFCCVAMIVFFEACLLFFRAVPPKNSRGVGTQEAQAAHRQERFGHDANAGTTRHSRHKQDRRTACGPLLNGIQQTAYGARLKEVCLCFCNRAVAGLCCFASGLW